RERANAGPLAAQHCEAGHSSGRCVAYADVQSRETSGDRVQKGIVAGRRGCGHSAVRQRAQYHAGLHSRNCQPGQFVVQSASSRITWISTQEPLGICATPKELRACLPLPPNTSWRTSDAPVATKCCSAKFGEESPDQAS